MTYNSPTDRVPKVIALFKHKTTVSSHLYYDLFPYSSGSDFQTMQGKEPMLRLW